MGGGGGEISNNVGFGISFCYDESYDWNAGSYQIIEIGLWGSLGRKGW